MLHKGGRNPVPPVTPRPRTAPRLQKYATRPAKPQAETTSDSEGVWEETRGHTIYEGDTQPTGLLDEHGNEIYRMPGKIGFDICRD